MCEPGLTLALAVCEACTGQDYEEMTEILLGIFDSKRVIKFLKAVIEKEVAETGTSSAGWSPHFVLCGGVTDFFPSARP
jgi:hypothetical protein